jgi:nucleoside diphosphate kinase
LATSRKHWAPLVTMVKIVLMITPSGTRRGLEQLILDTYHRFGWIVREFITGVFSRKFVKAYLHNKHLDGFLDRLVENGSCGEAMVVMLENNLERDLENALIIARLLRNAFDHPPLGHPSDVDPVIHLSKTLDQTKSDLKLWFDE